MNKIFILGRLAAAPQARQTQNGKNTASFGIIVNRSYNRDIADYIPIVTWGALAESCAKYLVKGQQVVVTGELQTRQYEDKNGNKRTVFEVNASEVEFLAKPKGDTGSDFDREMGGALMDDEHLPF